MAPSRWSRGMIGLACEVLGRGPSSRCGPGEWSALYYPFADVRDREAFRLACLYFDRVFLMAPGFACGPTGSQCEAAMGPRSNDEIWRLIEAGLVVPLGPKSVELQNPDGDYIPTREFHHWIRPRLLEAIERDLSDPALQTLARRRGRLVWRLPTQQADDVNALRHIFEPLAACVPTADVRRIDERVRGMDMEFAVDVPWLVGESLMVNLALLTGVRLGLTPFTDADLHHEFLMAKLGFESDARRGTKERAVQARRHAAEGQLAVRSMAGLPAPARLTPERVLALRTRHKGELHQFRAGMADLVAGVEGSDLASSPTGWEEELHRTKVLPAVGALRTELGAARSAAAGVMVMSIVGMAGKSFVDTMWPGLSGWQSLALSLVPGLFAGGAKVVSDRRRLLGKHFCSYLLRVEKAAGRPRGK